MFVYKEVFRLRNCIIHSFFVLAGGLAAQVTLDETGKAIQKNFHSQHFNFFFSPYQLDRKKADEKKLIMKQKKINLQERENQREVRFEKNKKNFRYKFVSNFEKKELDCFQILQKNLTPHGTVKSQL